MATPNQRDNINKHLSTLLLEAKIHMLGFYVLKLVVCYHIQFNKIVIEKLKIIILNPIN